MSTYTLRPWTVVVKLHPDVEAGALTEALNVIPEGKGFARPGEVGVAVFDGEKFDARNGKKIQQAGSPFHIKTMWGWIAWQIDPEKAFPLVAEDDQDRFAPGGDVIRELAHFSSRR